MTITIKDRQFAQRVINSLCLNGFDDRDILEDRASVYREECIKTERERVLAEFEGHYAPSWMPPGDTYTVCVDDMRRIIAKLRTP